MGAEEREEEEGEEREKTFKRHNGSGVTNDFFGNFHVFSLLFVKKRCRYDEEGLVQIHPYTRYIPNNTFVTIDRHFYYLYHYYYLFYIDIKDTRSMIRFSKSVSRDHDSNKG